MLNSKENMAHAVGGAVIGVAVGMVMQKILSPRCVPQAPKSADNNLVVCCEKVKKRSRSSDLRFPSNCHKNSRHRRSKSSSGSKRGKKECSPSAASNSQDNRLEIKRRSRPPPKTETSQKLSSKSAGKSVRYSLNTSTEYRTFVSKVPEKLFDIIDFDFDRISCHQPFETTSTEYMTLMLKKNSKNNEKAILMFDINNQKSASTPEAIGDIFFNTTMDYTTFFQYNDGLHLRSKLLTKATDKFRRNFFTDVERDPSLTMSTEYLPLELEKKPENALPSIFTIEVDDRDSDFINTGIKDYSIAATCGTEFCQESIETTSTEYLIRNELENASESDASSISEIINRESSTMFRVFNSIPIHSKLGTERANFSIDATYNTFDREINFDLCREEHAADRTEELY